MSARFACTAATGLRGFAVELTEELMEAASWTQQGESSP